MFIKIETAKHFLILAISQFSDMNTVEATVNIKCPVYNNKQHVSKIQISQTIFCCEIN